MKSVHGGGSGGGGGGDAGGGGVSLQRWLEDRQAAMRKVRPGHGSGGQISTVLTVAVAGYGKAGGGCRLQRRMAVELSWRCRATSEISHAPGGELVASSEERCASRRPPLYLSDLIQPTGLSFVRGRISTPYPVLCMTS